MDLDGTVSAIFHAVANIPCFGFAFRSEVVPKPVFSQLQQASVGRHVEVHHQLDGGRLRRPCVRETEFQCRSFDFDNLDRACLLYSVNLDDTDVHLIPSNVRDHYESELVLTARGWSNRSRVRIVPGS